MVGTHNFCPNYHYIHISLYPIYHYIHDHYIHYALYQHSPFSMPSFQVRSAFRVRRLTKFENFSIELVRDKKINQLIVEKTTLRKYIYIYTVRSEIIGSKFDYMYS